MKFVSAVASVAAVLLSGTALASDATAPSAEQVLDSLAVYHQTDTSRFQVGPRWSEQYGWAIDASGGMMLSEALAVGLVVTFGENDRELVFNTGLQLDDTTIIIGTLAGHQQNVRVGDEREWVDQLEGGISLRSDDGVGFIGGYEANAYATRSSTGGSLATGTILGAEYNVLMHPIDGMTARLGAGYEKITWDDGSDPTEGWTANLNVTQKVGETVSLKAGIDLGQSEDRYTAGTEFLLADNGNSYSRLGLEYSYIVDKDGGDDDQRLTAYWRMGFGEGSEPAASAAMGYGGDVALENDTGYNHDRILSAVMKKPDYLPANVLAASGEAVSGYCYALTTATFLSEADVLAGVQAEFGPNAVIADWAVIKSEFGTDIPTLVSFMDSAGVLIGAGTPWVNNAGIEFQSGTRRYTLGRFDGTDSSSFAAFDNLYEYLKLGSWYGPEKALSYLCSEG